MIRFHQNECMAIKIHLKHSSCTTYMHYMLFMLHFMHQLGAVCSRIVEWSFERYLNLIVAYATDTFMRLVLNVYRVAVIISILDIRESQ